MYMNQVEANRLLNNSNSADFNGRRDMFGATLNSITSMNNYFGGQNLPQVKVVDYGFQIEPLSGPETAPLAQYQKFISNGVGILVGKRPGNAPVGHFQMTINASNPHSNDGPISSGPYMYVKDYFNGILAPKETPGKVEVHAGMNGGLSLEYPYSVVACQLG